MEEKNKEMKEEGWEEEVKEPEYPEYLDNVEKREARPTKKNKFDILHSRSHSAVCPSMLRAPICGARTGDNSHHQSYTSVVRPT